MAILKKTSIGTGSEIEDSRMLVIAKNTLVESKPVEGLIIDGDNNILLTNIGENNARKILFDNTGNFVISATNFDSENNITKNIVEIVEDTGIKLNVDTTIGDDKFIVDVETGNTNIEGTLDVTKATTLESTLDVTEATTLSNTLDVTSNTTVGGTLDVTGATTLSSTLDVTGNTTIEGTLNVAETVTSPEFIGLTNTEETTFRKNLLITENFGNYQPNGEVLKLNLLGTSIESFIINALQQDRMDNVILPTASYSLSNAPESKVEPGETIDLTFSNNTANLGQYPYSYGYIDSTTISYGDTPNTASLAKNENDTGVTISNQYCQLYIDGKAKETYTAGTNKQINCEDGKEYKITYFYTYSNSNKLPLTLLGKVYDSTNSEKLINVRNPEYPDPDKGIGWNSKYGKIIGKSNVKGNSTKVNCLKKYFYGYITLGNIKSTNLTDLQKYLGNDDVIRKNNGRSSKWEDDSNRYLEITSPSVNTDGRARCLIWAVPTGSTISFQYNDSGSWYPLNVDTNKKFVYELKTGGTGNNTVRKYYDIYIYEEADFKVSLGFICRATVG